MLTVTCCEFKNTCTLVLLIARLKNQKTKKLSKSITKKTSKMKTVNFELPATIEKNIVRASLISVATATLTVKQNDSILYEDKTEGMNLSESFARMSNILHYELKAKRITFDAFNNVVVILTFGDAVYTVIVKRSTDKTGKVIPVTSSKIGQAMKGLYHSFAADVLIEATKQGAYFNFVHAANSITRFTAVPAKVKK